MHGAETLKQMPDAEVVFLVQDVDAPGNPVVSENTKEYIRPMERTKYLVPVKLMLKVGVRVMVLRQRLRGVGVPARQQTKHGMLEDQTGDLVAEQRQQVLQYTYNFLSSWPLLISLSRYNGSRDTRQLYFKTDPTI